MKSRKNQRKRKVRILITENFLKGCAGKVQHKEWLAAQYALENNSSPNAEIYTCRTCGYYHIGTRATEKKIIRRYKQPDNEQHKRKHKRFKY